MTFTIRPMVIDDLEAVTAIDQASFTLPWPRRSFQFEITENPAARCWVAESSGRIVGSLVLWMLVDEAHIATLATRADARRKGIGRALLIHALSRAVGEGALSARLEVRAGNRAAQDLYRELGFEEVARRSGYYRDNLEDAVLMANPELPDITTLPCGEAG